jgi:hypothetical protein
MLRKSSRLETVETLGYLNWDICALSTFGTLVPDRCRRWYRISFRTPYRRSRMRARSLLRTLLQIGRS